MPHGLHFSRKCFLRRAQQNLMTENAGLDLGDVRRYVAICFENAQASQGPVKSPWFARVLHTARFEDFTLLVRRL